MASYYHSKQSYLHGKQKKRKFYLVLLIILFFVLILPATTITFLGFRAFFRPNVWIHNASSASIYIPTDATFGDVKTILYSKGMIINRRTFEWMAHFKEYDAHVKPGRYIAYPGMSNYELIRILNSGEQTPVKVIINNIRTKEELALHISKQIEADSVSIIHLLNNVAYLEKYGFNPQNILMMFIPNTYEFYWNTSADKFIEKMEKEYQKFWNDSRMVKLNQAGLSREEVIILASIIEKETNMNDEKPRMAGVYINRLKGGWPLQADPTVVYAAGDYSIQRVLSIHKEIDSPYNTYKVLGLPPGPICLPSIASIDAVLNYEKNNYYYFCARDDFSGYHEFSSTYAQQMIYARRYQKALDKMEAIKH